VKETTVQFFRSLRFPIQFLAILWVIHIIKFFSGLHLGILGVYPRDFSGLKGIITAPLIHGDWQHLLSNTVPLAALMAIIFIFYKRVAVKSFILIYLLTGLAVWLFARSVFHIGASGVVYGLVSFVFWTGVFRRNLKSIVLSLIILVMYSGYFLGIVPGQEGISWESHLYGGVVGILIAYLFKDRVEADEIPETYIDEPEADDYFLRRDIFEKTINERQNESQGNWWESDQTF
jgi:membrane associated rhomboid family serine protease